MAADISEKSEESGNLQGDTDNENSDLNLAEKDLEKGDGEDADAGFGRNPQDAPARDTPAKDPNLIEWDGPDDPDNPMNWSKTKKWISTIMLGIMTFCVTFASSVFSNATEPTAIEYGVSTEVTTLGTSLFVLGFAVGPLVSALFPSGMRALFL
jgi:hypothetical protein